MHRPAIVTLLALAGALHAVPAKSDEVFIRLDAMSVAVDNPAPEAVTLAVSRFVREVKSMTGVLLPVRWGGDLVKSSLRVGNRSTFRVLNPSASVATSDPDVANQSYALAPTEWGIMACGMGSGSTPRSHLGTSYALGELLRRLDQKDGEWGFRLPLEGVTETPAVPNRTLYLMNSNAWFSPGLSLDYDDHGALETYVDSLIEARFSRVSLWQWYSIYLYPGNHDERRAENERVHRGMRHLFDYARRRGLEVYHQLTPMHANPDLLPNDPKFVATGYYGRTSVCWSQPEARDLARAMAQHEMEYYGPVDGYIVWFYDPGGCFCPDCWKHQGGNLFEQLMTVVDLARSISPNAAFEACLWPTWCFHEAQWGINFPREEVKAFVREFLEKALAQFGPRNLTIMDNCDPLFGEYEYVICDGTVKPEHFKRNAFMHRALGTPGEASYPFAYFNFRYLDEAMGAVRQRGLEEALLTAIYVGASSPVLYAFANTLWDNAATWEDTLRRYASTMAKGDAYEPFVAVLTALEDVNAGKTYAARDEALTRAEAAFAVLESATGFRGSLDWLRGYVRAFRGYSTLAQTTDQAGFDAAFAELKKAVGAVPMYRDFMEHQVTPEMCVKLHLSGYWRGPVGDPSMVGLSEGDGAKPKWIGGEE